MVLTTINSEGYFRSMPSYDINEQLRLIEHIYIVIGTDDTKKSMTNPTVLRTNKFKVDYRMFDIPQCKLAPSTYWTVMPLPMHTIYGP
jgi:hypothetical protein